jgi:hypothetical protein
MKKVLLLALSVLIAGCSSDINEDEPVITIPGNPIIYTMTNYVENEVITIITHENGKTVPTVKNIATINYGITLENIAIDEDNGTHGIAFQVISQTIQCP